MSSSAQPTCDIRRDREAMRRQLDHCIGNDWLAEHRAYYQHVRRWMDCAPDGALFLIAPFMGLDGTPFVGQVAVGPQGRYDKSLREARTARGLHPLGGRFDAEGKPQPPSFA